MSRDDRDDFGDLDDFGFGIYDHESDDTLGAGDDDTDPGHPSSGEGDVGESGLTEEFDLVGDEFSDELDELEEDHVYEPSADADEESEPPADPKPSPDELEEPPSEFHLDSAGSDDEPESSEPEPAAEIPSPAPPPPAEPDATVEYSVTAEHAAGEGDAPASPAPQFDPEDLPDPDDSIDSAQLTIEADTLALADREAAGERAEDAPSTEAEPAGAATVAAATAAGAAAAAAAAAGAPTAEGSVAPPAPVTPPPPPGAVTGTLAVLGSGPPPDVGKAPKKRLGWRFAAASLVIISSVAAVSVISALMFADSILAGLNQDQKFREGVLEQIEAVDGGDPQTILVLGSDIRTGLQSGNGLSDTAMLVRVDPDQNLINVFSLPRDMGVNIPGYGYEKLNAAYAYGGPPLAVETIRKLLGIEINHVVNVDFEGFKEIVDAIDCVYVDVDQHYYHSNEGLYGDQLYMEIDIPAGYNRLCGYRALQYVRYRHTDDDLVRAARQQDFLREARQRVTPAQLWTKRNELLETFANYTEADISEIPDLFALLKTFISVHDAQVRQIEFDAGFEESFVVPADLEQNVKEFLGEDTPAPKPDADAGSGSGSGTGSGDKEDKPDSGSGTSSGSSGIDYENEPMDDASDSGYQAADAIHTKGIDFPMYYPTVIVPGSSISLEDSRSFALEGPEAKEVYHGYKFVLPYQTSRYLEYYGVSGVNWPDAPILANPTETKTVDGKEYMLFWAGGDLRLVGWKTEKAAYWVNNTLTHAVSPEQMLAVTAGLRRYEP